MLGLRPYQEQAVEAIRQHIREGKKRILLVAPTGSGKTVCASYLMYAAASSLHRCTFVVDRISLIDQTSAMLDRYGIGHGVQQSQHQRWQPHQRVQVCSIQTLSRRRWPDSDLDILDESHVLYKTHIRRMATNKAITVGLTATPFTRGLGKHWDAVVNVTTTQQLIHDGWLCPYRIYSCQEPDMEGVTVTSLGEWKESEASERALKVVGDVVAEYLKHGEGRKFICSGVDTAHVMELARQFREAGIPVATYTYKDRDADRADSVAIFRKPDSALRGLITVTAASRGFDVPDVSCIIMARPLRKSLAEHIQLFGRGLRIADGKKDCVILDHSGNAARFFEATETFFSEGAEALDMGGKPEKKKPTKEKQPVKCPVCRRLHMPAPTCPSCGHVYPQRRSKIQHAAGTLHQIASRRREQITQDIWPQVVGYVHQHKGKNHPKARAQAYAIFRDLTGVWPTTKYEIVRPEPCGPDVQRHIMASQIRYAHRRRK